MRSTRARAGIAAVGLAALAVAGAVSAGAAETPQRTIGNAADQDAPQMQMWEIRVVAPDADRVVSLSRDEDLLERRDGADYFVLGDAATVQRLQAQGLHAALERPLPNDPSRITRALATGPGKDAAGYPTYYGGYHTVDAQFTHLADTAKNHPDLAKTVVFGKTWKSAQGSGSDPMEAICITKLQAGDCALTPDAPKPRAVVFTAIHSREIATAEIAWNWIDLLTTSYGKDPAITRLLDTTEMWVIPLSNPDGSRIVQSGGDRPVLQRKNADDRNGTGCSNPPISVNQPGVDLNRNFSFAWSGTGASTNPCDQDYHGPRAGSEPETQAMESLLRNLFADHRGPGANDPASAETTGTVLSYHSYAGLVIYPWDSTANQPPDDAKLAALAKKLTIGNAYASGQTPKLLYEASGAFDDFVYGELGVPALTTELGSSNIECDGFTPPYSCVTSEFWPEERQNLMIMAQAAAGPYL